MAFRGARLGVFIDELSVEIANLLLLYTRVAGILEYLGHPPESSESFHLLAVLLVCGLAAGIGPQVLLDSVVPLI
jgi:hypothetical protein